MVQRRGVGGTHAKKSILIQAWIAPLQQRPTATNLQNRWCTCCSAASLCTGHWIRIFGAALCKLRPPRQGNAVGLGYGILDCAAHCSAKLINACGTEERRPEEGASAPSAVRVRHRTRTTVLDQTWAQWSPLIRPQNAVLRRPLECTGRGRTTCAAHHFCSGS